MAVVTVAGHELFGVPIGDQFPIALHDNGDGTYSVVVYDQNTSSGASGSFVSQDGKTVTISNGIVTLISS